MLYIASAQPPTPILQSLSVSDLTSPGSQSLVIAKPDRIEVWDVGPTGLAFQTDLEVWGSIIGIEKVVVKDARPHILVLLGPPDAQLLVLTYNPSTSSLIVASSTLLNPPTPSLRLAEFYRGVTVDGSTALVSLWVGVLSCIELEVEKEKDLKRRRSSAVRPGMVNESASDKRLRVRETFNINVREQNLLSLAFHSGPPTLHGPIISMLSLSPHSEIQLNLRSLSTTTQTLHDLGKTINVVTPQSPSPGDGEGIDYGTIPFSCPGARHVIPAGTLGSERLCLVVGDEYSVLYSFNQIERREASQQLTSSPSPATSPRASAVNRSPQSEMKQIAKRRKSSTTDGGRWQIHPVWRVRQGFGTVLSATTLESSTQGGKILMSDDSGRLTGFSWTFGRDSAGNRNVNIGMADMGHSSPASSLTPLSPNHLFCASASGDSTLLHLEIPSPGPPSSPTAPSSSPKRRLKGKGKEEVSSPSSIIVSEPSVASSEVMERWINLAPVKDFCAVGDQSGGTSHLVIASGSSNSNSLRVVRSGAGLERVACIEGLEGVERVWSVDLGDGISSLLLSTASSTSLLKLSPETEEIDLASEIASTPTLASAVLPGSTILAHVTATAITLWDDLTTGKSLAIWQAPGEITFAQIHQDTIVVSTVGGDVHVFKASSSSLERISHGNVGAEVSAVAIVSTTSSTLIAIGTWTNLISIYAADQLHPILYRRLTTEESFFASSIMLRPASSNSGLQLLAGLSDGSLVTYEFDFDTSTDDTEVTLRDRKISSLGTRPLTLHPIQSRTASGDELLAIGLSDRTSIIFLNSDRIDFSSVSLTGLVAAAAVNTEQGPSLVMATPTELSISQVDGLKKLHIQTLDTGYKSAGKLVWLSTHRAIAAGVIERTIDPITGDYWQTAWVELRDQDSLKVLASMTLGLREEMSSISEVLLNEKYYIAVGTALLSEDEDVDLVYEENTTPAKEGRLLLLDPVHDRSTGTWSLDLVTEMTTVGAVNDITRIHEFLAYAAASKVSIMKLDDDTLTELSSFSSTFIAHSLFTAPPSKHQAEEKLIVGDGMRSVLMLEVDDESGMIYGDDRDMATHQVVALAGIKDRGQGVVVADGSSNILTFRLRDRIEPAATFGLHEQIVRFTPGAFAPPASAPDIITPDLIYATIDGRLGMIGELSLPSAKILDDLQRNMDKFNKGPGGVSWRQFRRGGKPLVPRDTAGFIDGDFVQKFLGMDIGTGGTGEKVMKGGSVHEQVTRFGVDGKTEAASRADVARVLEAAAGFH